MKAETLKNIFYFLEEKHGAKSPWLWRYMNNMPLTKEDLIVNFNFELNNSKLTSLPEGLYFRNSFLIKECINLTSLPEGLIVRRDLALTDCPNLTSLPENLDVGREFLLWKCQSLTSLPEGLKVGTDLKLSDCPSLTSLPEGLKVDYLSLTNCPRLTSLPKGLQVEYDLYIRNMQLAMFSYFDLLKMIEPNGYIKGKIVKTYI